MPQKRKPNIQYTNTILPKAGLSAAAAPKLKFPICGAGLLETGVPNWGTAAPKAKPPGADLAVVEETC